MRVSLMVVLREIQRGSQKAENWEIQMAVPMAARRDSRMVGLTVIPRADDWGYLKEFHSVNARGRNLADDLECSKDFHSVYVRELNWAILMEAMMDLRKVEPMVCVLEPLLEFARWTRSGRSRDRHCARDTCQEKV
jgi:hypothetical protein